MSTKKKHLIFLGIRGIAKSIEGMNYIRKMGDELNLLYTFIEIADPREEIKDFSFHIINVNSFTSETKFYQALDQIHAETPFEAIACFSEELVQTAAKIAEHYHLVYNSLQTAICTTNKYEMRKALKSGGVPVPEFYTASTVEEAIEKIGILGYPCIIKPVQLYFSMGVKKINSDEELRGSFNWTMDVSKKNSNVDYILVEKFIDGKEYSAEVIVNKEEIIFRGFTDKYLIDSDYRDEIAHIHPYTFPEELEKKVHALLKATIKAVNVQYGGCHIEFKIEGNNIYIIEIATRLAGGSIPHLVRLSTNIDLINMVLKVALQEEIQLPKIKNQYAGIKFITCDRDCTITCDGLPPDVFNIPGVIQANLLFKEKESIKIETSGCERIGYVIARNRDKDTLVESLNKADTLIKNTIIIN